MSVFITLLTSVRKCIPSTIFYSAILILVLCTLSIGFEIRGHIKDFILVGGVLIIALLSLLLLLVSKLSRHVFSFSLDLLGGILLCFSIYRWSGYLFMEKSYIPSSLLMFSSTTVLYILLRSLPSYTYLSKICLFRYSLVFLGVLQSIIGICQFLFIENNDMYYKTSVNGTLFNPNILGAFLNVCLGASYFSFKNAQNNLGKYIYVLSTIVIIIGICFSFSRGTILATILSITFLLLYRYYCIGKINIYKGVFYSCIIVVSLCAIFVFLDIDSSRGRWMKLQIAYEMISDHPFWGCGEDSYSNEYANYQYEFINQKENINYLANINEDSTTNNQYSKYLIEYGIVGFLMFLAYILCLFKRAFSMKYHFCNQNNWIVYGLLCLFIQMFFEELFLSPVILLLFILLSAFLIPAQDDSHRLKLVQFLIIIAVVANVIMSCIYISRYVAMKYYYQADFALRKGDYTNAAFFSEMALQKYPNYIDAHILLGRSLVGNNNINKGYRETKILEGVLQLEKYQQIQQSRDVYLALSLGYFKLSNYVKALEYAKLCHDRFPTQTRPILMMYLIAHCIDKEYANYEQELYSNLCRMNDKHPDKKRISNILSLLEDEKISPQINNVNFLRMNYLLNLIVLSH